MLQKMSITGGSKRETILFHWWVNAQRQSGILTVLDLNLIVWFYKNINVLYTNVQTFYYAVFHKINSKMYVR